MSIDEAYINSLKMKTQKELKIEKANLERQFRDSEGVGTSIHKELESKVKVIQDMIFGNGMFWDIETSGFGANHLFKSSKEFTIEDAKEVARGLDITEYGFGRAKGKVKQVNRSFDEGLHMDYREVPNSSFTSTETINGQRIKVRHFLDEQLTPEALLNGLKQKGKRLSVANELLERGGGNQYINRSRQQMVQFEMNGKNYTQSEFSFKDMLEKGSFLPYEQRDSSPLNKMINEFYSESIDVMPTIKTKKAFIGQMAQDAQSMLNASEKGVVDWISWNIKFDPMRIVGVLANNGHEKLARELLNARDTGRINLKGAEETWADMVFQLAKENPKLADVLRIRNTPEAMLNFEHIRLGSKVRNSEEILFSSMKWSASFTSKSLFKIPAIQKALPLGREIHSGAPDTVIERTMYDVMKDMVEDVQEVLINKYNITKTEAAQIRNIADISKLNLPEDSKVMTEAFNRYLYRKGAVKTTVQNAVIEPLIKSAKYINENDQKFLRTLTGASKRIGGSGGGEWRTKGIRPGMRGLRNESLLAKFAIPGLVGAAALLSVYGLGGDERSAHPIDKLLSYGRLVKNMFGMGNGTPQNKINTKEHKYKALASTIGLGVLAPFSALWAIGFAATKDRPNLLGVSPKLNTIGDYLYHGFKTALWGAKKLENEIPMFKVLRASSIHEYLMGGKKIGQIEQANGDIINRSLRFTTAKRAGTGMVKVSEQEHGVLYHPLMDAAEVTQMAPEDLKYIKSIVDPNAAFFAEHEQLWQQHNIEKMIVNVTKDSKGRAVVYHEFVAERGVRLSLNEETIKTLPQHTRDFIERGKNGTTIKAGINIHRIKSPNIMQGVDAFGFPMKDVTDPVSYAKLGTELRKRGFASKLSFEEYMKNIDVPLGGKYSDLHELEHRVKHYLDIAPKGISSGKNILYGKDGVNMDVMSSNIKTMISVTKLTDEHFWTLDNAKAIKDHLMPLAQDLTTVGMNNFLESPFEFMFADPKRISKYAADLKASDNILKHAAGKVLSFMHSPHLGLSGADVEKGLPGYLLALTKKRILPGAMAIGAFGLADHVLGAFSDDGRGPLTKIPIKAFEGLSLLYTKLSDITGLTAIAKHQERVAPGSTGPGILAPALSLASVYKTAEFFYKHNKGFSEYADKLGKNIYKQSPFIRDIARNRVAPALRESMSPLKKFASFMLKDPKKAIFAVGMLPMLPFLPGFLGSTKSYEERKAEYKGKKEVAVRKNRGWLLSTSPFEGDQASSFRRHALNLIESDWENRGVVWPSFTARFAHNITGGLYGRYMLENYHASDQPVYQSAPYGASIPIIGPIIASTVGRFIKPTIDYHKFSSDSASGAGTGRGEGQEFQTKDGFPRRSVETALMNPTELAKYVGITDESNVGSMANRSSRMFHDFIGFRGFMYESIKERITGLKQPDEFTPYKQSAMEMYNPAQQMWAYKAGDVGLVSGEFLRRIFMYPEKRWEVNNIPNELSGVSWIPQQGGEDGKKSNRDLTRGTTFDKVDMGWLYGSRKGWEFLFPTMKGKDLEQYPSQVRTEILKHIAPHSTEFDQSAHRTNFLAISNQLDPMQEQRYYETMAQVGELRQQLYSNEDEFGYNVDTMKMKGKVDSVDNEGRFTIEGQDRVFRLAGVSLAEEDVRATILRTSEYSSAEQVSAVAMNRINRASELISSKIKVGGRIEFEIPAIDQMIKSDTEIEVQMGGFNKHLIESGAAFADTGNLSKYNIAQQISGLSGKMIAKYWDVMTSGESFWLNKLIPKKDYLSKYLYSNVFNREVKLWQHPIEQIFKPMVASTLHKFGIDKIPQFTVQRRRKQEYWDIIKYLKGKKLEAETGDPTYRQMWKETMIGSNPVTDGKEQLLKALPQNEKIYFDKFISEPDPKKRGKILKFLPAASRRIYTSIWEKEAHNANLFKDREQEAKWENIEETEGFGMSEEENKQFLKETNGLTSKANWKRAKYIEEFAKNNPLPDASSHLFDEDVDLDNVELLSLREQGENVEDYGFFEDKIRQSAFDAKANFVAIQLNSKTVTSSSNVGQMLPYIMGNDAAEQAQANPTMSINPILVNNIQTNHYAKILHRTYGQYAAEVAEDVISFIMRR